MPLDANDSRKVPTRPTVTSFCDRCHTLTKVTQYRGRGGKIEWLCTESCAPNPQQLIAAIAHSPPPADPVASPLLDQWLELQEPTDLDADVPQDLLDLEIDRMLEDADAAREPEPIAAEQGHGADDHA
jgi:hypothetical protein